MYILCVLCVDCTTIEKPVPFSEAKKTLQIDPLFKTV